MKFLLIAALNLILLLSVARADNGDDSVAQTSGVKKPVIDQIYDKINELFGNDVQLFSMEYPGRVLDEKTYYYSTKNSSSQYLKPQAVAEAEFRLSNAMFDVSQISGGPNGESFSSVYEEALNRLVPKWTNSDFRNDKEKTRKWLTTLTEAPSSLSLIHPTSKETINCGGILQSFDNLYHAYSNISTSQISLMDLHTRLATRYNNMKLMWNMCKLRKMKEATTGGPGADDEFFRWLAVVGDTADTKVSAYWQDLVVRGYHHDVMQALGFIDRKTPGELIQEARNNMQLSAQRSIDGSMTVHQVELQPDNWAESLSTHFTSRDLLTDYDALTQQMVEAQQNVDQLSLQLSLLRQAKEGDKDELEAQVQSAETKVANVQTDLITTYGKAVADIVDIYLVNKYGNGKTLPTEPEGEVKDDLNKEIQKGTGTKAPLSTEQVDELLGLYNATAAAQRDLTLANQELTDLSAALAAAETTDYSQAIAVLTAQMNTQSNRARKIKNMLLLAGKDGNETDASVSKLVATMPAPGPWQTVIMSFDSSQSDKKSSLSKSASHKSWNFDLIFASGSGSSSTSSSDSHQSFHTSDTDIEIGFEATKVTIDRGGWFDAQVFRQSESYMRLQDQAISRGPPGSLGTLNDDLVDEHSEDLFPAYPVAFVIARDVTIKLTAKSDISDATKSYLSRQSSSSGGFLCFSYAQAKSSTDTSQSFHMMSEGKAVTIKIPGAQILGWYLEFVPKDNSTPYTEMPEGYWPTIQPMLSSGSTTQPNDGGATRDGGGIDVPGPVCKVTGDWLDFNFEQSLCLKQLAENKESPLVMSPANSGYYFSLGEDTLDLAHLTVSYADKQGDGYGKPHLTCRWGSKKDNWTEDERSLFNKHCFIPVIGTTKNDAMAWADNCAENASSRSGKNTHVRAYMSNLIEEVYECV